MLEPLTCPQCGAPLRAGTYKCDYCDTVFAGAEPVFKIDARLGAACIPVLPSGGNGGAGGNGCAGRGKAVLYAYDRPILEVDE